jgi:hypothetical protein
MPTVKKIQFGDGLDVTDLGGGKIRVDGSGGGSGGGGAGGTYVHTQSSLAAVWTVTHNLNAWPSVTVVDSGGSEVIPTLQYTDANTLVLTFGAATSGKAYLN